MFASGPAWSQAIDPDTLTPRPGGTNQINVSFDFAHFNGVNFTNGSSSPQTHYDAYTGHLEVEHYFSLFGQLFALGVGQGTGLFDNLGGAVENSSGSRQLGLTNTTLLARYWPYIDQSHQAFVAVATYLIPPDGTNSEYREVNIAENAWHGTLQLGGHKGFGPKLSFDAAADATFTGDRQRLDGPIATTPIYQTQLWANWDWTSKFRTSLGYTGVWGGSWTQDEPYYVVTFPSPRLGFPGRQVRFYGYNPGLTPTGYEKVDLYRSAARQAISAQASYWWTPRVRTSLTVERDIVAPGGPLLGLGATALVKVLF